jgi:hypothetical protein
MAPFSLIPPSLPFIAMLLVIPVEPFEAEPTKKQDVPC